MYPNNKDNRFKLRDKQTRSQSLQNKNKNRGELLAFTPYTTRKNIKKKYISLSPEDNKDLHVKEPENTCKLCGKPIAYIAEALSYDDGYVHFDCALDEARKKLNPSDKEKVSYMGSGRFAKVSILKNENVFDERLRRNKNVFEFKIVEEMNFESKEQFDRVKTMVEELRQ